MKIAAVVVTYNVGLNDFIFSVSSYNKHVDYVIIVDNSIHIPVKNDLSAYALKNNVIYIDMQGNKGIGKALNIGIEHALSLNCDWVLTMDQDSHFVTDLNSFKQYIYDYTTVDVAIIAPSYEINNEVAIRNESVVELPKVIQSGNLINTMIYVRIGKFNESYFIDYVDYEYCKRAICIYKLRVLQINTETLKHKAGNQSVGRLLIWKYNYIDSIPVRNYYQVRNGIDYIKRYHDYKQIMILFKTFFKVVLLSGEKLLRFKYMIMGIYDYMRGRFGEYHENKRDLRG